MQVVIRTESSQKIGVGHVIRCLTLASTLRKSGADVSFVCATLPGDLADFIAQSGFVVERLPPLTVPNCAPSQPAWPDVPWQVEVVRTRAAIENLGARPDWIVYDHYVIDARVEGAMRDVAAHILVIDDLANRPHDCDILLDQNFVSGLYERYDGYVSADVRRLLGPQFALLHPAYAQLHGATPPRHGEVLRVLVFFSGADIDNLTGMAIGALRKLGRTELEADFVITASHPFAEAINSELLGDARFRVHVNLPTLAPLMARADFAIGAVGMTSWERACVGLPSLVISMADNQLAAARELHRAGIVHLLGHKDTVRESTLVAALEEIFEGGLDPEWSRRCAALVDGRGGQRVSDALFAINLGKRRQLPHKIGLSK